MYVCQCKEDSKIRRQKKLLLQIFSAQKILTNKRLNKMIFLLVKNNQAMLEINIS